MPAGRALITGIAGQDGSYLAELLVREGWEVTGLVRPPLDRPFANLAAVSDRVRLVAATLEDRPALAAAIREAAPGHVYHLAAPTYVPASWDDPAATLETIAVASATVLRAAGECGARVLVASSAEIFGATGESPQHEGSPRRPLTPYGVAKLAAHDLVGLLREGSGLHGCAVVTYNHESPRRPERFVTRRITKAVAAIRAGRQDVVTLGDLQARRDWSHARDVVRGMHLALCRAEPGDYVLASGATHTVEEFALAAFAAAGVDPAGRISVDPSLARPSGPALLVGDATRARETLGWRPEVSFEGLVAEMVEADLRAAGL